MHAHPAQREHGLRHREQRRLRAHQGPALGVGGHRLASEEGRGEPRSRRSTRCMLGLSLGATFLARSFSGDKEQLIPILKAAVAHNGFALIDVISPCVTFNDHEGSTKSYKFMREHEVKEVETDFVPMPRRDPRQDPQRRRDARSRCTTAAWCASARCPRATTRTTGMKVEEYIRDRHQSRRDRHGTAVRRRERQGGARDEPHADRWSGQTALLVTLSGCRATGLDARGLPLTPRRDRPRAPAPRLDVGVLRFGRGGRKRLLRAPNPSRVRHRLRRIGPRPGLHLGGT